MIKKYLLIICLLLGLFSNKIYSIEFLYWYDEANKISLWMHEYSNVYQSFIYTESPSPEAQKQILTGRIIVVFFSKTKQNRIVCFYSRA